MARPGEEILWTGIQNLLWLARKLHSCLYFIIIYLIAFFFVMIHLHLQFRLLYFCLLCCTCPEYCLFTYCLHSVWLRPSYTIWKWLFQLLLSSLQCLVNIVSSTFWIINLSAIYEVDKFYVANWQSSHKLQATWGQLLFHSCKMIHYKDSNSWLGTLNFYILFHKSYHIICRDNKYLSHFSSTITLKVVFKIIGMLDILPHGECILLERVNKQKLTIPTHHSPCWNVLQQNMI